MKNKDSNPELTGLQNFEESLNKKFNLNVKIKLWFEQDKRKKTKFILSKNDISISPPLNYEKMNIFLIAIYKAKRFNL